MNYPIFSTLVFFSLSIFGCNNQETVDVKNKSKPKQIQQENKVVKFITDSSANTIGTRFGFSGPLKRQEVDQNSFQFYLRNLVLKPIESEVKLYNGDSKWNNNVYCSVVDLPIGKKDLHQCADAIMHLKARYHYERQEYDSIGFHFVNGFYCDYRHWKDGYRTSSNKTAWVRKAEPNNSEETFWRYLETVFMFAGTASLTNELKPIELTELRAGDVFIRGGSPGHAVVVLDLAIDTLKNEKYFILGQSYMPAQDLQVLKNNKYEDISPWVSLTSVQYIVSTPEWTFEPENLKRF
jgi:hypothetical protein